MPDIPHAWAKLDAAGLAALPLADHGGDVASVFAELITATSWAARLERLIGWLPRTCGDSPGVDKAGFHAGKGLRLGIDIAKRGAHLGLVGVEQGKQAARFFRRGVKVSAHVVGQMLGLPKRCRAIWVIKAVHRFPHAGIGGHGVNVIRRAARGVGRGCIVIRCPPRYICIRLRVGKGSAVNIGPGISSRCRGRIIWNIGGQKPPFVLFSHPVQQDNTPVRRACQHQTVGTARQNIHFVQQRGQSLPCTCGDGPVRC